MNGMPNANDIFAQFFNGGDIHFNTSFGDINNNSNGFSSVETSTVIQNGKKITTKTTKKNGQVIQEVTEEYIGGNNNSSTSTTSSVSSSNFNFSFSIG